MAYNGVEFYYYWFKMSKEQLDKVKAEVQKILDKHLEEHQKFSVQDLDEESIFLLIDLLLEKDDLKRERIWKQIQDKNKINGMNIRLTHEQIMEIKDKIDFQRSEVDDLRRLEELIRIERDMDNQLWNI